MLWMLAPTWWIPSQAFLPFPKVSFILFFCVKLLSLMGSFLFVAILLECLEMIFLTKFLQLFFLYVLQLRVSDLIFTSLIQSLFLYRVRGVKFEPSIYMVIQFSLSHFLKRLPLYISGSLFNESVGHRCMGVIFAIFLFHWSMCLMLCQYYIVLAVNGCVICPEIMYCGFSMFVLMIQIALLICGLLCFRVNFSIVFLVL